MVREQFGAKSFQFPFLEGSRFRDDEGMDNFAENRVRATSHRRLDDPRMAPQNLFDLGRADPFARLLNYLIL